MGMIFRRKFRDTKTGTVRECATWSVKLYVNGRPVVVSTGSERESDARRLLKKLEGDAARGMPVSARMDRIRFNEAMGLVTTDYAINRKRSAADVQRRIDKHLKPWFNDRRLVEVTSDVLARYVQYRQEEGAANATCNRELAIVKRAFALALRAGKIANKPYVAMLREDNTRRGFFEREQFVALREKLPADLRPLVSFMYLTGWRSSEVRGLEWRQVDWAGRGVRLDPGTTKSGDGRTFPFTAELEALLVAQFAEHNRLKRDGRIVARVFHRNGEPIKSFRKAWQSACAAAGLPGRIVHDFRRTSVRNLERAGVSRSAAMAMVGHKTESIYRRYAIVDAAMLQEAAAKLDRAIEGKKPTEDANKPIAEPSTAAAS
jgi:integrase